MDNSLCAEILKWIDPDLTAPLGAADQGLYFCTCFSLLNNLVLTLKRVKLKKKVREYLLTHNAPIMIVADVS